MVGTMAAVDPRSELAAAQAELQAIEYNIAAKQAELQAVQDNQDKMLRSTLRLEVQNAERQKAAATRRLKAAQVKVRKAELLSGGDAGLASTSTAPEDDWTEHLDAQSGRSFFYNAKTGETSWTKPASASQATVQAKTDELAATSLGWTEHLDPQSGTLFYYNAATGETSWTKPALEASAPALQEGWTEHTDPASGNTFFYNAKTGETSWTRPQPASQQTQVADSEWTENIDPSTGNKFYFNVVTQESSWTKPALVCQQPLQSMQPTSALAA